MKAPTAEGPRMPHDDSEPRKQMSSFVKPDFDLERAKKQLEERFDDMTKSIESVKRAREVDDRDLRLRFRG